MDADRKGFTSGESLTRLVEKSRAVDHSWTDRKYIRKILDIGAAWFEGLHRRELALVKEQSWVALVQLEERHSRAENDVESEEDVVEDDSQNILDLLHLHIESRKELERRDVDRERGKALRGEFNEFRLSFPARPQFLSRQERQFRISQLG